MEETKVDFVPEKETKHSGKFQAKCFHCKEKEVLTTDNGMKIDLPYALVEIKKDKEMLKEFKEYAKESKMKYGKEIDTVVNKELNNLIDIYKEKKGPFNPYYLQKYYQMYIEMSKKKIKS